RHIGLIHMVGHERARVVAAQGLRKVLRPVAAHRARPIFGNVSLEIVCRVETGVAAGAERRASVLAVRIRLPGGEIAKASHRGRAGRRWRRLLPWLSLRT